MKKAAVNIGHARIRFGLILSLGIIPLLMGVTGCTTYVEQPRSQGYYQEPPRPRAEYVPPPPVYLQPTPVQVEVVIRTEDDFYEPLSEYGRWEVVGSYGRCWIPDRVDRDWRPYCNGHWERTESGWYWASDEPWGWATYHYGRWDLSPRFGWYWVPQTQWAPAWVSWHEGGGYVGWAPLQPSVRISSGGSVAVNVALIAPRAFVFVEPRRFLEPVRPATVVVNNTTIIKQTVNITNIKVVNNTVINEGPRTQIIEQASGQQVRAVPVRELRRKQEAEVVTRQRSASAGREKKEKDVPAPVRNGAEPGVTKAPLDAPRRTKESEATAREQAQPGGRELENRTQAEAQRRAEETAAKAQETARSKAKAAESAAQLEAQRHSQESDRKVQAEAQRTGRGKAKEAEITAQRQPQPRGNGLDKKAKAEVEKKASNKRDLRPKRGPFVSEPSDTNSIQKAP